MAIRGVEGGPRLLVNVGGHIEGILRGENPLSIMRHVVLHKSRHLFDPVHPRPVVEGVRTPQRWKRPACTFPVDTMAARALREVDLSPARGIRPHRRQNLHTPANKAPLIPVLLCYPID